MIDDSYRIGYFQQGPHTFLFFGYRECMKLSSIVDARIPPVKLGFVLFSMSLRMSE
jgi:hypothetical protein